MRHTFNRLLVANWKLGKNLVLATFLKSLLVPLYIEFWQFGGTFRFVPLGALAGASVIALGARSGMIGLLGQQEIGILLEKLLK